ncbi:TOMM precursor leader peptide-binding protein [Asanoa hainanensis]|uniref:TOMM precursor leader peptide-binding protein n=1 Tax=Asanoa hainanensis TaxID=560556 RepID=UPI000B794E6C|nr:TOMM precursor leader peptide-binding protein [Asanoa hainanensis]
MTTIGLLRPTLLPGLTRLRRGPRTLQFGLDPGPAVLVELPSERTAEVLDLLDGTHTERQVLAAAERLGVRPGDVRALLVTLHAHGLLVAAHTLTPPGAAPHLRAEAAALALRRADHRLPGRWSLRGPLTTPTPKPTRTDLVRRKGHVVSSEPEPGRADVVKGSAAGSGRRAVGKATVGLLTPAQVLRQRAAARVVVTGRGRLATPIAIALARSGVGHVRPDLAGIVRPAEAVLGLDPGAVGKPRFSAVAEVVVAAGARPGRARAHIIVQVGAQQPAELAAAALRRRGQAMLAVELHDGVPVIGPFVEPGGSPCLGCLDQHRTDRDPGWSGLAAGLATAPPPAEAGGLVAIMTAAALAAHEVLTYIDGGAPRTIGGAVTVVSPGDLWWRHWPAHPRCSCVQTQL